MADRWGTTVIPDRVRRALPARTSELSGDVIAYDVETAQRESDAHLDPLYWSDLEVDARWIIIGESGTGDQWLVGPDGGVSFFDHDLGERAPDRFVRMHLTVTEWLMAAHALGRFERIGSPSDDDVDRLRATLDAISHELADRWPYATVSDW